mmetsp:Transcript_80047/g.154739  ORF Transcript_80047/g.154739 Transcript_80047/m.154739 type:complete len:139 (-) Transcript_80047:155-571(-)
MLLQRSWMNNLRSASRRCMSSTQPIPAIVDSWSVLAGLTCQPASNVSNVPRGTVRPGKLMFERPAFQLGENTSTIHERFAAFRFTSLKKTVGEPLQGMLGIGVLAIIGYWYMNQDRDKNGNLKQTSVTIGIFGPNMPF